MRSRLSTALAGCALATLGVVAAAGQAQAATALAFTSKGCIPQGTSVVDCYANVTGGVGPYTWHWSNTKDNAAEVETFCEAGHVDGVNVRVSDATGASIYASMSFYCSGGPAR